MFFRSRRLLLETNTDGKHRYYFSYLLFKSSVPKVQPSTHRGCLINKFVCGAEAGRGLLRERPVAAGLSPPPSLTAQAAFCEAG